ncbi:hypothetical protein Mapa_003085 [Marchantia paleacea]|nr:hypothetical protein Mapa_003085 [Marchantia paleacea]
MTDSSLLPPEVLANVNNVDKALQKVEEQLNLLLPICTREVMDQLTPIEQASAFLLLSKTVNTLFCLQLKTDGVSPDEHNARGELERYDLYKKKVQAALDRSKGPQRPTINLDIRAANRFIEHAIPNLPEDKKKQLRAVAKQGKRHQDRLSESVRVTPKRRASGLTVAEEAAAFLAEASKEILTANVESKAEN